MHNNNTSSAASVASSSASRGGATAAADGPFSGLVICVTGLSKGACALKHFNCFTIQPVMDGWKACL
jgi:hypothetical protein